MSWCWGVARDGIYFVDNSAEPKPALKYFDFKKRTVRTVRRLDHKVWGGPGLAISPNEKTVLVTQLDDVGGDIMMVENLR